MKNKDFHKIFIKDFSNLYDLKIYLFGYNVKINVELVLFNDNFLRNFFNGSLLRNDFIEIYETN